MHGALAVEFCLSRCVLRLVHLDLRAQDAALLRAAHALHHQHLPSQVTISAATVRSARFFLYNRFLLLFPFHTLFLKIRTGAGGRGLQRCPQATDWTARWLLWRAAFSPAGLYLFL